MADRATTARVRGARSADAGALARLERRAFVGYYAPHRFSASQFRYYLDRPTTIAHVAARGDAVVGYALGVQHTGTRGHAARLYSIAIDPDARGRRLGHRLLRVFLAAARRRGCRIVSLEVAVPNAGARTLFERHGFVPTARLPSYYTRTVDGLRMRRRLEL